jgi:hypothetical protein
MVIMDELAIVFCSPLRNDGGFVVVCCQMGIIFTNKHKWSRVPEWFDAFQGIARSSRFGPRRFSMESAWCKLWACLENQSACEWIPKTLVKYVLLVLLLLIKSVLGILETDHDCAFFRSLCRSVSEIGYVVLIPMGYHCFPIKVLVFCFQSFLVTPFIHSLPSSRLATHV